MSENNAPLVSIIMGAYNNEKLLPRAIDSILNQTYKNIELIICDDCSKDGTMSVLKEYASKDSRIVVLQNKQNSGLAATLNHCITAVKGDFVARMDDDDISAPTRIETEMNFLLEHPEYAIVSVSMNLFDEAGIWEKQIESGDRDKKDIYLGRGFNHATTIMRKAALDAIGGYDGNIRRCEDYDLWCRFYYHGYRGMQLPDILYDYYVSKETVKRRKFKYRVEHFKLALYWRKKLALPAYYSLYAYKHIIAGLIPTQVMLTLKKCIGMR